MVPAVTAEALIRKPAVAGTFYPENPETLAALLRPWLQEPDVAHSAPPLRALIAPHAGFVYSGEIAAAAYRRVSPPVTRVVLLGPSHCEAFDGLALPGHDLLDTPLGRLHLDAAGLADCAAFPFVRRSVRAHEREHALETHFPFLQLRLPGVPVLPLLTGLVDLSDLLGLLRRLLQTEGTLLAVSSDLSHFLTHARACERDEATARQIEARSTLPLHPEQACGALAVSALLRLAAERNWQVHREALRNSGDVTGDRDRVVGYGAWTLRGET